MTANHRALEAADISLIEKVRSTPTLYDSTSPDFKFAYRKEQLWENVSSVLGMSAVDARRRWTCLRDRYSRELKQMRLHPDNNDYGNNEFFRQMDFLRRFVRKRRERRRIGGPKLKYESSWDGSADDTSKMHHNKSDIYEESQDQYDAKLEVATTEPEDGYSEFVEDGQINETFEEYEEQQPVEHVASPSPKYTISAAAAGSETPRHANASSTTTTVNPTSSTTTTNVIPIAYISHATTASGGGSNSYTLTMPQKMSTPQHLTQQQPSPAELGVVTAGSVSGENEDDFFCKTIGSYLRQLSRRHKIKAKVEMFQILDKYIELEENPEMYSEDRKG